MYQLVADVESYPRFLPWCGSSHSRSLTQDEVEASIEIVRGHLRKKFTTRNRMIKDRGIHMRLLKGPFRYLEGQWRFEPLGNAGCKVSLDMDFQFSNALMRALIGPAFSEIANSLVDSFCRRAVEVYGNP
jgi:ribosome-associated toxin RatA of RatAB toxin-antitoxin module